MKQNKVILIGGGGHAIACIDVIECCSNIEIIGYVDKNPTLPSNYNYKYFGDDNVAKRYIEKYSFLVTIGQIKNIILRQSVFEYYNSLNAKFITISSPNSIVSIRTNIGLGTIIMHGVIIQAGVKIGVNCIINDRVLIEHECSIGNHVHISTGAIINGGVIINDNCFIGSGTIIKQGVSIGKNVIIGAGSLVLKNISDNCIVYGVPAKEYKK